MAGGAEDGVKLAYVKNVTEKVETAALKSTLEKFGPLEYFDVSRQKVSISMTTPISVFMTVAEN